MFKLFKSSTNYEYMVYMVVYKMPYLLSSRALGRVRARAKVSCIQCIWYRNENSISCFLEFLVSLNSTLSYKYICNIPYHREFLA